MTDTSLACWCCDGTGKAFNAIDMCMDPCLICGGKIVTRPTTAERTHLHQIAILETRQANLAHSRALLDAQIDLLNSAIADLRSEISRLRNRPAKKDTP